ncbi:MAG TPA: DUF4239 domain-containing protein [Caldimonas sp.]|nr:DUF4239 domain-containing protein [Caldimonas sp.]
MAVALFAGIIACLQAGRRIGARAIGKRGAGRQPSTESLETAIFALLGLLIAFTFSGALTRFDVRRSQAVDEANAIGTAHMRVALLPESAQPRVRELLRQYVDARIDTYGKLPDLGAARDALARSQSLQNDLWARAIDATRLPTSGLDTKIVFLPALNQMFDLAATRLAATQIHPPLVVYGMLVALALAAALLAGYRSAADQAPSWLHEIGFGAIVACTLYVILDMEYPRLGFIRIDAIDQLLINARAAMT